MNAFASDRSPADAATDPSVEPWLYRSEGFAEDLDEAGHSLAAAPRHNPRPYWKGSDGVLEPVLEPIGRVAGHGLAVLLGRRLGGAGA